MDNNSSIILRIANFLRQFHPFCFFSEDDLYLLASKSVVSIRKPQETLFQKGNQPEVAFYIVKKGSVDIIEPIDSDKILVDKCGEGDMFGLRPLLAESPYLFDAISNEKTILYEIPIEVFKDIYINYEKAVDFMVQRFAAGRTNREEVITHLPITSSQILAPAIVINPSNQRKLITTTSTSTIHEAVQIMDQNNVSSIIIVDQNNHPVGIITDRDIRKLVANQNPLHEKVTSIMNHPVKCVHPNMTLQEIQLTMIESGLHHLCVTQDGTPHSQGLSMITEHDILYASATDPVVILKKIKTAKNIDDLLEARIKMNHLAPTFLNDNINRRIVLDVIAKLNSALVTKTIEISLKEYNDSNPEIYPNEFCFYSMGSMARGEQIIPTDQDNGMIIHDDQAHREKDFKKLAYIIVKHFETLGYEKCPADMMVTNVSWRTSLEKMKQKITSWILEPGPDEVLLTAIFFDFKFEFGNEQLATAIKSHIANLLRKQDNYIRFLARQTISNPPPLSFFRKFIIEKNGEHKDLFDIKLRAISPLSDSARVLALDDVYLESSNTLDRYEYLKEHDEANIVLYDQAIESYLELLSFKLKFALESGESGRYINVDDLDKLNRIKLRQDFEPARKILDMIERKYKLSYL